MIMNKKQLKYLQTFWNMVRRSLQLISLWAVLSIGFLITENRVLVILLCVVYPPLSLTLGFIRQLEDDRKESKNKKYARGVNK
jgi:hypothetical protein